MKFDQRYLLLLLLIFVFVLNGCAILNLPGQIIGGTFSLLGKLIGLASKLPKPPPWVFF